jgi:hypothetical protein
MRKADLTDDLLYRAVSEMIEGLVDGDLGGKLLKKRIGLFGRGKRGSARTIVATNHSDRWFFLYGFEKNERSDISKSEIKALRELAHEYLALDDKGIETAIRTRKVMEVHYDDNKA